MAKKIAFFMAMLICFFNIPLTALADDNATGGGGGSHHGKYGIYSQREYIYKVSLYLGTTDKADINSNLGSDFKKIGPTMFIKKSNLNIPPDTRFNMNNKVEMINGANLSLNKYKNVDEYFIIDDNIPPIPITNGGNIPAVKSYFGDRTTLLLLIDKAAQLQNKTKEQLVNLNYTVEGKQVKLPASEVLPIKKDGKYINKMPWLIVYEPVIMLYCKDKTTVLGFTATEYALTQKLGLFNYRKGDDGQWVWSMAFINLPNSVVLEESWFGYPALAPTPSKTQWAEDRIIQGGGWGMRLLKAVKEPPKDVPPDPDPDPVETTTEYRTNTDVVTGFVIHASEDITPTNKHLEAYRESPQQNDATVTITTSLGNSKSTVINMPSGSSQYAWIKWRTPNTPKTVTITATIEGNSGCTFENGARQKIITAKIQDLVEKTPPHVEINDPKTGKPVRKPNGFWVKPTPGKINNTSASWNTYSCKWHPNLVEVPYTVWISVAKIGYNKYGNPYTYMTTEPETRYKTEDHGWWDFFEKNFSANLDVSMNIKPGERAATAKKNLKNEWEVKSGYAVQIEVKPSILTTSPNDITTPQNSLATFPEHFYQKYNRVLELEGAQFVFKPNKYSTYKFRQHFIPWWYPDKEKYTVYTHTFDMWTPAGQLEVSEKQYVMVDGGSAYDDWYIAPMPVKRN